MLWEWRSIRPVLHSDMIQVTASDLNRRFSGAALADYLAVGSVVGDTIIFDEVSWHKLARKHGPAGVGFSVTNRRQKEGQKRPLKTGCFGVGDLVHFLVRPVARFGERCLGWKTAGCAPCQSRRRRWNKWRICWR
jgi:hypothetical protein